MINKRLLKADKPAMKHVMINVFYQWLGLLLNVLIIGIITILLSWAYKQQMELVYYFGGTIGIVILLVGRYFITLLVAKESYRSTERIKLNIRSLIFEKLERLNGKYQEHISKAELIQITSEGVDQLEIYFSRYLPQFFYSMIAPLTLFIIVSQINLPIAILLFICVPLIPISIVIVQKIAKKLLSKYWSSYTKLGDNFLDNIQGLTTLKVYDADQVKHQQMNEDAESFRKATMKVLVMQLNSISVMDLVAYGGTALGGVMTIYQLNIDNISPFQAIFIILIAAEFFLPMRLLGSFFHIAMNGIAASKKIFDFLDTPEPKLFNYQQLDLNGPIELNNLSFKYPDRDYVLKNVSMQINKGLTGIVGASGCGKTTVANLIYGNLVDYNGSIKINNYEQTTIHPKCLNENITMVSFDSYIFKGTFRDNLLIGNPSASDELLKDTLRAVNLEKYIVENNGLDSKITEDGNNLSGGQKQRLALARSILRNTPIYIFDEATSNIDSESEQIIIDNIYKLAKNKIVILISHRLGNVVQAKQIYTLDKGNVVEHGTHKQLLKNKGLYHELFTNQKQLESIAVERGIDEN